MQEYRPDFQFTVQTADSQSYQAQGYDAFSSATSDRTSQQAIVDQYTVGETYPCWYNPANPSQAVLTRPSSGAVFFAPVLCLFVGGVFVIVGIIKRRSKITGLSEAES